jgi:hypothetical protein
MEEIHGPVLCCLAVVNVGTCDLELQAHLSGSRRSGVHLTRAATSVFRYFIQTGCDLGDELWLTIGSIAGLKGAERWSRSVEGKYDIRDVGDYLLEFQ